MEVCGKRAFGLLQKIGFTRVGGSEEELRAANILLDEVRKIGFDGVIEPFNYSDAKIVKASFEVLEPYQKSYTVTGYKCSLNTQELISDFIFIGDTSDVSLKKVKGKFVLTAGKMTAENYKKLVAAGITGFMTMSGTVFDDLEKTDLDTKKMRETLAKYGKLTGLNIRMIDAMEIIRDGASKVKVSFIDEPVELTSHNLVVTVPGSDIAEEVVAVGAHYDSVPFSTGVYDNGAGSVIIMELLRYLKENPPRRTVKFIWFGSEELGLLGSHAYLEQHAAELSDYVFMINVDVGGAIIGREAATVSADESLVAYLDYLAKIVGFSLEAKSGIMSSDSTPFNDKGIPAVSFNRGRIQGAAVMHTRDDIIKYLSPEGLFGTANFLVTFAAAVLNAEVFPVPSKLPADIVDKVNVYLDKKPEK